MKSQIKNRKKENNMANKKANKIVEQKFREAIVVLIEKGIETKNPATVAAAAEIYKMIKD